MVEKKCSGRIENKTSRRSFLLKTGGLSVGLPLVTGSAAATNGIGTLAQVSPQSNWMRIGESSDRAVSGYTAEQSVSVYRWGGSPTGSNSVIIPMDAVATVVTHNNNSPVGNIDINETGVSVDSSEPGHILQESMNEDNAGGYGGVWVRNDNGGWADAVLKQALEIFGDFIGDIVFGRIWDIVQALRGIYKKKTRGSVNYTYASREWDWPYRSAICAWSEYILRVDNDKACAIDVGNSTTCWSNNNLFSNARVGLVGGTWSLSEIEDMTAKGAKKRNIQVYDLEAVEENPRKYRVTRGFLKNYDGDYLYKVPIKAKLLETNNKPSSNFLK